MKLFNKKTITLAAVLSISVFAGKSSFAQEDVAKMIQAGAADASKLVDAYISPFAKGFGAGLNGGWYNTAKPHGLGRFDVTVCLNAAFIPDADKVYDATKLGFQKLTIKAGTGPNGQTIAGDLIPTNNAIFQLRADDPTTPTVDENETVVTEFDAPPGTGLAYSGAPTAQISIGLIKHTELMIRYMPTIALGDAGDVGLFGFGVKHDFKQWIPGISKMPFDLSAYFGYTKFDLSLGLALPAESGVNNQTGNTSTYKNQALGMTTTATTFGAIISKKLAILTVYGGLNYQMSKTSVSMSGDYPLTVIETRPTDINFGQKVVSKITDPVAFDVEGANGVNATIGARLKLLILTFQGSYTFAKYPLATVGVGLNIDWK